MIPVPIFIEIMLDTGKLTRLGHREEVFDRLMQSALVAFESQHILATLVNDLPCNLTLTITRAAGRFAVHRDDLTPGGLPNRFGPIGKTRLKWNLYI